VKNKEFRLMYLLCFVQFNFPNFCDVSTRNKSFFYIFNICDGGTSKKMLTLGDSIDFFETGVGENVTLHWSITKKILCFLSSIRILEQLVEGHCEMDIMHACIHTYIQYADILQKFIHAWVILCICCIYVWSIKNVRVFKFIYIKYWSVQKISFNMSLKTLYYPHAGVYLKTKHRVTGFN
jgi:hypothetical protein